MPTNPSRQAKWYPANEWRKLNRSILLFFSFGSFHFNGVFQQRGEPPTKSTPFFLCIPIVYPLSDCSIEQKNFVGFNRAQSKLFSDPIANGVAIDFGALFEIAVDKLTYLPHRLIRPFKTYHKRRAHRGPMLRKGNDSTFHRCCCGRSSSCCCCFSIVAVVVSR